MNSKQRRSQRRRFKHTVTVTSPNMYGDIVDMLEWCHVRYGVNGYVFQWKNNANFSFSSGERAMEFKVVWA